MINTFKVKKLSTQPYKGTRDFYPAQMRFRNWMFGKMRESVKKYGYEEYDGPMLESFDIYAAKTGEEIVNQQLYWLMDQGERKLAIRPEMTPTLARMVAAKVQELPKPIRWFSIPNLWRYERPQRGRLREHWQLNVDCLGGDSLLAEAEVLSLVLGMIDDFGGLEKVQIKVNHRGLINYLFGSLMKLDDDKSLKLMKLVDARVKLGEDKYDQAVKELGIDKAGIEILEKFLNSDFGALKSDFGQHESYGHLSKLFRVMKEAGLEKQVVFDPLIFRGLDYYTGTVFEMYDVSPDNNRAIFGGGRYDNLIGLFGKHQLSGVGFGFGDVTFQNFLETHDLVPNINRKIDAFVTLPTDDVVSTHHELCRQLRQHGLNVSTPLSVGNFGSQLKMAARDNAHFAVLLGEKELADGKVGVKNLKTGDQKEVLMNQLGKFIKGAKDGTD